MTRNKLYRKEISGGVAARSCRRFVSYYYFYFQVSIYHHQSYFKIQII